MCKKQLKPIQEIRSLYMEQHGKTIADYPALEQLGIKIMPCECDKPVGDGLMILIEKGTLMFDILMKVPKEGSVEERMASAVVEYLDKHPQSEWPRFDTAKQ